MSATFALRLLGLEGRRTASSGSRAPRAWPRRCRRPCRPFCVDRVDPLTLRAPNRKMIGVEWRRTGLACTRLAKATRSVRARTVRVRWVITDAEPAALLQLRAAAARWRGRLGRRSDSFIAADGDGSTGYDASPWPGSITMVGRASPGRGGRSSGGPQRGLPGRRAHPPATAAAKAGRRIGASGMFSRCAPSPRGIDTTSTTRAGPASSIRARSVRPRRRRMACRRRGCRKRPTSRRAGN